MDNELGLILYFCFGIGKMGLAKLNNTEDSVYTCTAVLSGVILVVLILLQIGYKQETGVYTTVFVELLCN